MLLLYKFDTFLVNKYQKISDKFQENFGKDNFFLAKVFLTTSIVLSTLSSMIKIYNGKDAQTNLLSTGLLIVFLNLFSFLVVYFFIEINKKIVSSFENPLKIALRNFRLIIIALELVMHSTDIIKTFESFFVIKKDFLISVSYLQVSHIMAYISLLYFVSCTPKPPSKSKVKILLEKLVSALEPKPMLEPN